MNKQVGKGITSGLILGLAVSGVTAIGVPMDKPVPKLPVKPKNKELNFLSLNKGDVIEQGQIVDGKCFLGDLHLRIPLVSGSSRKRSLEILRDAVNCRSSVLSKVDTEWSGAPTGRLGTHWIDATASVKRIGPMDRLRQQESQAFSALGQVLSRLSPVAAQYPHGGVSHNEWNGEWGESTNIYHTQSHLDYSADNNNDAYDITRFADWGVDAQEMVSLYSASGDNDFYAGPVSAASLESSAYSTYTWCSWYYDALNLRSYGPSSAGGNPYCYILESSYRQFATAHVSAEHCAGF